MERLPTPSLKLPIDGSLAVLLALTFIALTLLGCGKAKRTVEPPQAPAESCRLPEGYDFTATPFHQQSTHLERHFQFRRYYSCTGARLSEGEETVKSPTKKIQVPLPLETVPPLMYCDYFNHTTCAMAGRSDYEANDPVSNFTADYSYGFFNLHVQSGDNLIGVRCDRCRSVGPDRTCLEWEPEDFVGTTILTVTYEETRLPAADVRPDPDSCAP